MGDFTGYSGPAGGDWDMLIGEGRVRNFINCYIANQGIQMYVEDLDMK